MAAAVPKTKAGKSAKVAKTMGEFKSGDLQSSSGDTVTNPKQAVAIALSQTGQSRSNGARSNGARSNGARSDGAKPKPKPRQTQTQRLAQTVSEGVDKRQERKR